ncbi:hypothetical protein FNV43_RR13920 [Rhamnella rubrinervis]|uniref:Uncharacterized protein n=1 Tax=Rhamnella rubrinervis TaxID=2594499 RepID=A0A8K0MFT2_9ROSA|nr:hypothetical protein FNV43_RR13920 [Rhamnella rubrinervis]
MASSSSHKSLQDYSDLIACQPQEVVKAALDEEEDESWLQLGLGLGSSVVACETQQHRSNPSLPSSETQFLAHHNHDDHIGLGLGLGLEEEVRQGGVLGFDYNEASVREIDLPMPSTINYDQSLWTSSTNYYHFDDHDHENMPSWQMDDSEEDGISFLGVHDHQHHHHRDWQMPVPNSYQYDYCSTSSSMRPNSDMLIICLMTNFLMLYMHVMDDRCVLGSDLLDVVGVDGDDRWIDMYIAGKGKDCLKYQRRTLE